jgi:cytoskeleton protein RodZ
MGADRSSGFGSRLRDARERKGVSLREIATRTKISIAVLDALERNDISRLPGGIFSRAFVRAYAHEVGLDPEETVQEFVAQFPHDSVVAGHSVADPIEDNVALESDRRVASTVLWMIVVAIPLAGFVMYFATAGRPVPADTQEPSAIAAPPPANKTPVEATAGSTPPATVDTAGSMASTAPQSSRGTPPSSSPASAIGSASTSPAASASRSASASGNRSTPAAAAPARSAADEGSAASVDRLTVGLAARRTVYVSAIVDGRTVISRLLQPGDRTSIEVSREMVLTAGDAAALSLTLNGAEARALGKAGQLVSTRLTPANFKEYLVNR